MRRRRFNPVVHRQVMRANGREYGDALPMGRLYNMLYTVCGLRVRDHAVLSLKLTNEDMDTTCLNCIGKIAAGSVDDGQGYTYRPDRSSLVAIRRQP